MLVEVELDLLVGDVDTQLLERVLLEVLEAEDVQDSHIHAALRCTSKPKKKTTKKKKTGTNKLILVLDGRRRIPQAAVLIDKTLMTTRVQPKYSALVSA